MPMSDAQYAKAVKRILGDENESSTPGETTTPQSIEECAHLKKRIASLESIVASKQNQIVLLESLLKISPAETPDVG
jgi:hypothetical protein